MTQLERVHFIYSCLEQEPMTVSGIYEKLKSLQVDVGQRQIYHDLEQIRKYYLRKDESLAETNGQYNRKLFRLIKPADGLDMNSRDITTFQLTRSALPRLLQKTRKDSMDKFKNVYRHFIKANSSIYSFMSDEQNIRTNFYEASFDEKYNQKLDDIIWAISNYKKIEIRSIDGDATSLSPKLKFPIRFKPIYLISHRGNYFVAGFEKEKQIFLSIDISKIREYALTDTSFLYKKLLHAAKAELKGRFGITNNMDESQYKIELEFTSVTGEFIRHYFWHETQEFKRMSNGNWLMTLHCGINRELLGWIFQWMSNVRINAPKKLIEIYVEQLHLINQINALDTKLQYRNIFTSV